MKNKTRTEIRVETYEFLTIRNPGLSQGWCEHCGKQVARLSLEEAARAGLSREAVTRQAAAGRLHFIEITEGLPFICLNSLAE